jgi:hypothetical protein
MAVFTAIGASIFGAGTFMAALTAAALQTAAGIGLSLIGKAISGNDNKKRISSSQVQLSAGEDQPRTIGFGWYATGGSLVYANTFGGDNAYMVQVIALADLPVRELQRVFVDGSPVTLLTGDATERGAPVSEFRKGGTDHLWIKFYDGTQTTADSYLTGTVSSTERPYSSDRVGRGIAYAIVTARAPVRKDGEEQPLFPSGYPKFKFELYGARLYDISKDTTAGGAGSQRWNDPSTWGGDGDFLPAVQAYNILRGVRYGGGWLYGLQDVTAPRLPAASWIAAIDACRELIATDGEDDEPQYRSGREIAVSDRMADMLDELMTACQGRLIETGGSYKITVGAPGSSVFSLSDGDIISIEEQSFSPFFGLADTINGVAATWLNPAEGWAKKAAPPLIRTDLEALANGRRLMASVALDSVPYGGQVQRLQKSALLEAQRARRHTFVLGPEAQVLEAGDIVSWTSARNGYVSKLMRVDGVADRANLDVMIDMTEVDPDDYEWDPETDYTPIIDGEIGIVGPPALVMTGWQAVPATIKDDDGEARRPSIKVSFDGGLSDVKTVRIQVRTEGEAEPFFDGEVPYAPPYSVILNGQFPPNTRLEVRGILVRESGMESTWSSWLLVTTDDIKLGAKDINVDIVALAGDVLNQMGQIRVLIENFKELGTTLEESDRENYQLRETLSREISVRLGNLEASFTEIIEVALDPDGSSAMAIAIQQLRSALGDNSAEINIRWDTAAAPTGYSARYVLQAAVNDGTFRSATLFLDVPSDSGQPTRIGLMAGQTVFFTSGGTPLALIGEDGVFRSANDVVQIDMITGNFSITVP